MRGARGVDVLITRDRVVFIRVRQCGLVAGRALTRTARSRIRGGVHAPRLFSFVTFGGSARQTGRALHAIAARAFDARVAVLVDGVVRFSFVCRLNWSRGHAILHMTQQQSAYR